MQQKSELQTNDKIQGQVEYPHNLLRNIAKESALTEYVLGKLYQNTTNRGRSDSADSISHRWRFKFKVDGPK